MSLCPHIRNCWGVTRLGSKGLVPHSDKNWIRKYVDIQGGEDTQRCDVFDRGGCPIPQLLALGFDGYTHYRSEIPPVHARARYAAFVQDMITSNRVDLLQEIESSVAVWFTPDTPSHMWLYGAHDVGKSWLAAALAYKAINEFHLSCLWIPWSSLASKYGQFVTMAGAADAAKFNAAVTSFDVIVLDGFGEIEHNRNITDFFSQLFIGVLENGRTRLLVTSTLTQELYADSVHNNQLGSMLMRRLKPVIHVHYTGAAR